MRRGWTRGQASIVVAVVAWAVVVVFTVLSIVVLAKQGTEIVTTSTKGSSALAGVDWPSAIASGFGGGILATIKDVLTGLAGLFVGLVLSAVLSFFVLRDGSRGWVRLTHGLSGWRHDIVDRAGTRAVEILGGYIDQHGRPVGLRGRHPVRDHGRARAAARRPSGGSVVLPRVHPIHRELSGDRASPCSSRSRSGSTATS